MRSVVGREEERVPPDAAARPRPARRRARRAATSPASDAFFLHDTLGFPIDLTREIAEERGRARRPRRLRRAHAGAAHARAREAHKAAGGKGAARRSSCTASCVDELGAHRVHRPPGVRDRRRQGARRSSAAASASAQADAGTDGRRRARPHAVLRRVRRPGRRHRHDRRPPTARASRVRRHAVRPSRLLVLHRGEVVRGHDRRGRRGRPPRSTARAATASAATTPPRTSCTGRCARCSART